MVHFVRFTVHSPIVVVPVAETAIAGRWMAVLTRIASRSQVHRQSPSTAGSRHRTPQAGVTSPAGSCPSSLQLGPEVGCNGPQTRFAGRLRSSSARLGTAAPAAAVRGPPTARRGEPATATGLNRSLGDRSGRWQMARSKSNKVRRTNVCFDLCGFYGYSLRRGAFQLARILHAPPHAHDSITASAAARSPARCSPGN